MPRCLNPKKAHENRDASSRSVLSGATVALSEATSPDAAEEQVACQFCKYLLEGAVLGDCRVVRWIGCGAFGDVYEAEQLPPLSRRVAIKVMSIERVVDGESAEMFAREVSTIAALDHPNILPVLRAGMIEDGRSYLVMKYAAQGSLQQFCQPALPAASFVPTRIVETPLDTLAIVAADTLNIAEVLETSAECTATTGNGASSHDDGESERTRHKESNAETSEQAAERPEDSSANVQAASGKDEQAVPEWQLCKTPLAREVAAHKQTNKTTRSVEESECAQEQAKAPVSTSVEELADSITETVEVAEEEQEPTAEAHLHEEISAEQLADIPVGEIIAEEEQAASAITTAGASEYEEAEPLESSPIESQENAGHEQAETLIIADDGAKMREVERHAAVMIADTHEVEPAETMIIADDARKVERAAAGVMANDARSPLLAEALLPRVSTSGSMILSPQQVLRYLEDAASALYYAHQRGLIHLDVKPANLLLDAQGRLMLADFGVSVLLEGYTHASLHYYVGTPLYTAPEQWLEQPRPASDQYALAITCYQLLAGRAPFTGNLYAVMHGHLQAPVPPMSTFNPLIPQQIEAVIQRALEKDPAARYPTILDFAQAYREALESAASATTDVQMQKRATLLLEQHTVEELPSTKEMRVLSAVDEITLPGGGEPETKSARPDTFKQRKTEWENPDDRRRHGSGHWLRNLLLVMLALLLIGGGLGFVRIERPCWLGICPQMGLNTNTISITNSDSQQIKLTNTGTDTLNWHVSPRSLTPYSWLTITPSSGALAPRHSRVLTFSTNVASIDQSGKYTDPVEIDGGMGVAPQFITVTENVVEGLQAVSVKTSGNSFLYEQSHLQPDKQTITLTNKSGHTLKWFIGYSDNNWLSVTPSLGNLPDKQSVVLTATVSNPQTLANDSYDVTLSLVGQLDNQSDPQLLQTTTFNLQVHQEIPITPTAIPPSPVTSSPLSFTAKPIAVPGAPSQLRSNHSMVWDTQNDQLLVFGGIDGQGTLLNDLWSYSPSNNQWTNLTPINPAITAGSCSGGSPSPRADAAMVWDNVDQEALLFGGEGTNATYLNDLWAYSPTQKTWTALACPGNGPGARGGAGVAWNGSQMLILGGLGPGGPLSDFWAYTPGANAGWSKISATTPLGARTYPTMSWDSKDKQLYVFGGLRANQQLGDFYVYQSGNWSPITPSSGAAPAARQQAMSTWDSRDGVFLLMGGWQSSGNTTFSATWAYSPTQNAWWEITSLLKSSSLGVIPSRLASGMVWDSTDNSAYVYAGSGGPGKPASNDLWAIQAG